MTNKEAIEILCDQIKGNKSEAMQMALKALCEPMWIPCSERLPEEDDYKPFSYYEDGAILFCTKNGKVGFGWYYESTKEWANEDDHTPGEVIAWMPLPEPYKEGAQDGQTARESD